MKRKAEKILALLAALLTVFFLGGFAVIANHLTLKQYQTTIKPVFQSSLQQLTDQEAVTLFQTLGAWFAVTLMLVLILTAVAWPLLKGHRKIAGGLLVAAGVITLFGSQLVAFPIAFFFFVAGGLALMRKEQVRVQDEY
ncbi:DUF4064 domain-containing protein [Enterococcus asini]|uniref:DUF4064 domain-containing protein n=2 Tax=Enterococcus asini TaxID=57732 RepID=R2S260_9ENTE|nr:DUF4064 domain-containing protein [Enterococcus asini]EOH86916.1 hypothetical protein UAS_01379 [Enterococcus asini ATCC 700915]EOT58161.1 hypothetical protein I579_01723 [Enterococcus asini ATCC 700915]MCD5028363.1 DUF4064 domain-containing protein [Enterococcus asini]MDT2745041.1 DUF4064 domain-containing protein [Enterococcus asini]MDT2762766.1 DUF4064 domain-containing protein [Enterococcus asini]